MTIEFTDIWGSSTTFENVTSHTVENAAIVFTTSDDPDNTHIIPMGGYVHIAIIQG